MRGLNDLADYFFICSAQSTRQAQAIADSLIDTVKNSDSAPNHLEGYPNNEWILVDCDRIVFHVFVEHQRAHYDLEGLWSDAKRVTIPAAASGRRSVGAADAGEVRSLHHR